MPHKIGVIPNMGDVSAATRIQLGQLSGPLSRTQNRRKRKVTRKKATTARRRKKTRTTRRSPRARARSRGSKPARMVKGSAAAKRHMAKLRRMRRKG